MGHVRKRGATAFAAGLGIIALALAGCSSNQGSPQSSSGSKPKEPAKITVGEAFEYPTDVEVPGLTGQLAVSSTGSEARWSYLPGQQAFNPVLASLISEQLDSQAASRDAAYLPEAHDRSADLLNRGCVAGSTARSAREILDDPTLSLPLDSQTQLTITCEPILAAGTTFGERVRFVRGNASDVVSDYVEVLYTDTETGEVSAGKELFAEAAMPALLDALYSGLKLPVPMSGDEQVPPSTETLADLHSSLYNVGFKDNGDIYVTVAGDFLSVLAAGNPNYQPKAETLVIPAERAEELLTPLGSAISSAKEQKLEWSGPGALPSGQEYVDCDLVPCVAVTYDDGPSYLTPTVLDAFGSRDHAAATFFVLGENIAGNEEILKRATDEGNEVANHSWNHPAFTTLEDAQIQSQVNDASSAIENATGQSVQYMRPPYGDMNDRTRVAAGMPAILWTVDTNDWQHPGIESVVSQAVWDATPDGIVLMHDIHDDTVAAAEQVVDGLLERGFTLVTVSQLFGETVPAVGSYFWEAEDVRAARG